MNCLEAIGIESWRSKGSLPGAKAEIAAYTQLFFDESGPMLRVIYPQHHDQRLEALLNQFWRAVECVSHYKSQKISFNHHEDLEGVPLVILSEALAQSIKESGLISASMLDKVICGDDPESIYATPVLKASWWGMVMKAQLMLRDHPGVRL